MNTLGFAPTTAGDPLAAKAIQGQGMMLRPER